MLTSSPENVDMNAANAPALVIPDEDLAPEGLDRTEGRRITTASVVLLAYKVGKTCRPIAPQTGGKT